MLCVTTGCLEVPAPGKQVKLYYWWYWKMKYFHFNLQGFRKEISLCPVTKLIFGVRKAGCLLTSYSSSCVHVDKQTTKLKLFTVVIFLVCSLSCEITVFTSAYVRIHDTWPQRSSGEKRSEKHNTLRKTTTRALLFDTSSFI